MKFKSVLKIVIITLVGIALNFCGKQFAINMSWPIWLDCIGTIFVAYNLGPVCGAIVGVSVNAMTSLSNPVSLYFATTSILIGVVIGYIAKRGVFDSFLRTMAWVYFIVFAAAIICVPYYWIGDEGVIGNVWGDGIVAMLIEKGFPKIICVAVGAFYVEFLDKVISVSVFYIGRKIWLRVNKKQALAGTVAALMLALSIMPMFTDVAQADKGNLRSASNPSDYDYYIQTVYNNLNGIPGGTANDVVHMGDGIIWIGTYSGLYRYNGTEFRHMNSFESVKNVNHLYVDGEGRLWIGTNDDGLSILINEEISDILDVRTGLPSDSVKSIVQQSSGLYFVGTSDSLAVVTLTGGIRVSHVIDEVVYALCLSADNNNHIAAVTDAGAFYLIDGTNVVECKEKSVSGASYSSCRFDEEGNLFLGTTQGEVDAFSIENNKLNYVKSITCEGLSAINCIDFVEDDMFVCADNGIGYINSMDEFDSINTGSYNNSVESITVDYQGNIWFASSRQGLLKLCPSTFYELYTKADMEPRVVNAIAERDGVLYFGTDTGLDSVTKDGRTVVKTDINQLLEGKRIRCIKVDSRNDMWVCTSGDGVYQIHSDESFDHYTSSEGLMGDKTRCAIELQNGDIALSGDAGVSVFDSDKKEFQYALGKEDGLVNPKILCLSEGYNGEIYAGSDGGGIYVIKAGKVTANITRGEGLSSEVILRIVRDEENKGFYLVTSNGISYMDANGEIKNLSNFPYSNNYDLYDNGSGNLFVTSSAGVFVVNKESLLNGRKLEYNLLDSKRGLRVTLTANAWNHADDFGNVYIAGGSGVASFNIDNFENSTRSFRMMIKTITLDNVVHFVDKSSEINIGRGVTRISFTPEVINFSAYDPYVSYYLEGFDQEKNIIFQSELGEINYTNLPAGKYRFHLAVLDGDGINPIEEMVYTFNKEKEIYDNAWFRDLFIIETLIIVGFLTWFFTSTQIKKTLEIQKKQLEFVREQVRMGDETIMAIARTVDAKDSNTSMHSTRVSEYSVNIAKRLGYSEDECELLRKIALLHDIGKIGVPDGVLNKPSRLTDEEYEIMKTHVTKGAEILKDFSLVDHVADGALYHHERYDGKGYVHGLKGEEIPLNARIIGIADAFDAMTANRVYRKKLPAEVVMEEIRKGRGTQFDPKLVDIFLELLEEKVIDIEKIYEDGGAVNEA